MLEVRKKLYAEQVPFLGNGHVIFILNRLLDDLEAGCILHTVGRCLVRDDIGRLGHCELSLINDVFLQERSIVVGSGHDDFVQEGDDWSLDFD